MRLNQYHEARSEKLAELIKKQFDEATQGDVPSKAETYEQFKGRLKLLSRKYDRVKPLDEDAVLYSEKAMAKKIRYKLAPHYKEKMKSFLEHEDFTGRKWTLDDMESHIGLIEIQAQQTAKGNPDRDKRFDPVPAGHYRVEGGTANAVHNAPLTASGESSMEQGQDFCGLVGEGRNADDWCYIHDHSKDKRDPGKDHRNRDCPDPRNVHSAKYRIPSGRDSDERGRGGGRRGRPRLDPDTDLDFSPEPSSVNNEVLLARLQQAGLNIANTNKPTNGNES